MADDDQKSERAAEVTGAHGHHHHHEPDGETPSGHVDHDPVCGMQEGVSETQFAEMTQAGVQLVVPAGLTDKFPKAVQPHLQSLESFIGDVRLLPIVA